MQNPSHVCDLHHSSWQWWVLNPLSEARDQTCILMDANQICFCWDTTETPPNFFFFKEICLALRSDFGFSFVSYFLELKFSSTSYLQAVSSVLSVNGSDTHSVMPVLKRRTRLEIKVFLTTAAKSSQVLGNLYFFCLVIYWKTSKYSYTSSL